MSEFIVPQTLTGEHGLEFAAVSGVQPGSGGRAPLDFAVQMPACRFPCDRPGHTHQWPAEMWKSMALDEVDVIDYTKGPA